MHRLARWAGVDDVDHRWQVEHGPWFDNGVMTIEFDGRSATVGVDHAHVDGGRQELDRTLDARAGRHAEPAPATDVDLDRPTRTPSDAGTMERLPWPTRSTSSPPGSVRPSTRVAGRPGVDPVVRPSDRADAQANGALALAKELGRNPREVAEAVAGRRRARRRGDRRDRRAGLHQPHARARRSSGGLVAEVAADDRLGVVAGRPARAGRRRLLGAERGQGDAHRAPPHDGDRRRAGPRCSTLLGHDVGPREPHRRLGPSVRHAHRAPRRHRRRAGRPLGARRSRRVLQGGVDASSQTTTSSRSGPAQRVVLLQQRRRGDDGAVARARRAERRALERRLRASSACC